MASVEIIIAIVLRMPEVIGGILKIRSCLTDGMLVKAVKAGLIDDVEDGFLGVGDGQRGSRWQLSRRLS